MAKDHNLAHGPHSHSPSVSHAIQAALLSLCVMLLSPEKGLQPGLPWGPGEVSKGVGSGQKGVRGGAAPAIYKENVTQ